MTDTMFASIMTGVFTGATASFIFWYFTYLREAYIKKSEQSKIYQWLIDNNKEFKWYNTRTIASYNNLTEDRVRYLCSYDERVVRSSGKKEVWGIKADVRK